MLFEGFGRDLVGEVAELEFVVAEEVRVVGGNEGTGKVVDLRGDGLADGLGEGLRCDALFRRQWCRRHGGLHNQGGFSSAASAVAIVYKNSTNFQDAYRRAMLESNSH